jgi:hypothetical protein
MRFAYIDSNGNEVPIPSVDALALRIELGAISDDTELYDAQADQWGPATSHEIYHTLARSSGDDDGFIAPPPVAPPPVAGEPADSEPGAAAPADPEPVAAESADSGPMRSEPNAAEPPRSEATDSEHSVGDVSDLDATADADTSEESEIPAEAEAPPEPDALPDLDLTLAPGPEEPTEVEEADGGRLDLAPAEDAQAEGKATHQSEAAEDLGFDSIALAPSLDPTDDDAAADDVADDDAAADDAAGQPVERSQGMTDGLVEAGSDASADEADETDDVGFDFGDMGGGLEVEATFDPPDDDGPAMNFSAGGFDTGDEGGLDLEQPMSEFSPEDPPAWMDHADTTSGDDGDVMDFSSATEDPDDVPLRDRRTPRNKPSRPKHRRQSVVIPIVGAVIVVALAVGGYTAWPVLSERLSGGGEPEVEPTFIPQISAELMPQMRAAAEASFEITFAAVRADRGSDATVASPSTDWLAGIYLANASDYEQVEIFWDEMDIVLEGIRAIDLAAFDAALRNVLEASAASEADAAAMRARADSGFVAAGAIRAGTFDQLQALIDSSVLLHQFLAVNQANIAYAPANAVTTDPVLEVNPATDEIRDAMEDLIDNVTRALGDLGYRDEVTAEGLWTMMLERIKATGIQ